MKKVKLSAVAAALSLAGVAGPLPDWAFGPFVRPEGVNPVIGPRAESVFDCPMSNGPIRWEESDTFNPAAAVRDGKICVLYRAEDNTHQGVGSRTSRLGYAETDDGVTMTRDPRPVLFPGGDDQSEFDCPGGCEDPRIAVTEDGLYVCTYTSWNRRCPRLCVATSRDLRHWKKHGPAFAKCRNGALRDMGCKSGAIVQGPAAADPSRYVITKVNGRYLMYWGEGSLDVATSDNLTDWEPAGTVIRPRPGYFDSALTEMGPAAIITEKGIVVLYNGKNRTDGMADRRYPPGTYCGGQILCDRNDPTRVLGRLDEPYFRPEAEFEKTGQYRDGTVFTEGLVFYKGKWHLYYGCADSFVGLAVWDPGRKTPERPPKAFRPPAVPLVQIDPFFSVWSAADRLTDADTTHWSGAKQPVSVLLEADGCVWRLCGASPSSVPALPQTSVDVRPTQTVCTFAEGDLRVELRFTTPKLPDDLDAFSRPVTYVTAHVSGALKWRLRPSISPGLATNDDSAQMLVQCKNVAGMSAVSVGRAEQKPLGVFGDRVRCDWGYAWLVGPSDPSDGESHFMLAYDDVKSVRYFGADLPAWWRRGGLSFEEMLAEAERERPALLARCDALDAELTADLERTGGWKYAKTAALAYRQSFAACKLVKGPSGNPFYFSKENSSGGFIGTVDVFYPQFPLLLLVSPPLARASLEPIMEYASGPRWRWPFAPHDLGYYPFAEGQCYGGGEKATDETKLMPVEESGNMLVCLAALAEAEGGADFAGRWWPVVTKWAQYLEKFGFDPGNQLCTDDFAGHLAHNANLSVKAIVALASYARLAGMRGERETAAKYSGMAKDMAAKWIVASKGGRYGAAKLTLDDAPGAKDTWAQKYNLAWDRVLGLGVFPPSVADAELKAYRRLMLPYGLPLDSRLDYTKADWIVWSATLTGRRDDFDALIDPLYRFLDETPDRVPFSDWYWTGDGRQRFFTARSVVGGVFMPLICDRELWSKWSSRGRRTVFQDKGGK